MTIGHPAAASATCPKHMRFGPCGGVSTVGGCEVDDRTCPFVDSVAVWTDPPRESRPVLLGSSEGDVTYLADIRPPDDPGALREMAQLLGPRAVGLLGEHLDDPTDTSVERQVADLAEAGLRCVATVTGRGRRHEARLRNRLEAGAIGLLCVTGDHPDARGLGVAAEFTSEGTRLASLARDAGSPLVAVAESPSSPPHERRVARLMNKQRAGADVVVLNHASTERLTGFSHRIATSDLDLTVVAPIPVVTDRASYRALTQFPGVVLPSDLSERVLDRPDGRRAGVDAAARRAVELLAGPGVDAVNLSGSVASAPAVDRARIMREIIDRVDEARAT